MPQDFDRFLDEIFAAEEERAAELLEAQAATDAVLDGDLFAHVDDSVNW
jgi:hypothetical protein